MSAISVVPSFSLDISRAASAASLPMFSNSKKFLTVLESPKWSITSLKLSIAPKSLTSEKSLNKLSKPLKLLISSPRLLNDLCYTIIKIVVQNNIIIRRN